MAVQAQEGHGSTITNVFRGGGGGRRKCISSPKDVDNMLRSGTAKPMFFTLRECIPTPIDTCRCKNTSQETRAGQSSKALSVNTCSQSQVTCQSGSVFKFEHNPWGHPHGRVQQKLYNNLHSNQHNPSTPPTTRLRYRRNNTSRNTGRNGHQKALTRSSTQREGVHKETATQRNVTQGGKATAPAGMFEPHYILC